eukprot:94232-Prorocentrum_minimum.AAC.1
MRTPVNNTTKTLLLPCMNRSLFTGVAAIPAVPFSLTTANPHVAANKKRSSPLPPSPPLIPP